MYNRRSTLEMFFKFWVVKSQGKMPRETPRYSWEDIIKICVKLCVCVCVCVRACVREREMECGGTGHITVPGFCVHCDCLF